MPIRTCVGALARGRGVTARWVARKLNLYPSNISGMDAGRRTVSLQMLGRIAQLLSCSPADLIEVSWRPEVLPFRRRDVLRRLLERDLGTPDGAERGSAHAVLLAWQRHTKRPRSKR